jgi:5-methylcytosine-specific restriction protein A
MVTSKKLGQFSSWDIVTDCKAIKHCDKSVFDRLGSSVPKPTRWFWGIDESPIGTRKSVTCIYNGKEYKGTINIYSNDLSQIFWEKDLKAALDFVIDYTSLPDMVFEKVSDDKYVISFLNTVSDDASYNSVIITENHSEGRVIQYYTSKYERSAANRTAAIKKNGIKCMACGFDFEEVYGELGRNFIEVHHIKPLYSLDEEVVIDPATDLVCLCSNCHRMIHRKRDSILSLEDLIKILKK